MPPQMMMPNIVQQYAAIGQTAQSLGNIGASAYETWKSSTDMAQAKEAMFKSMEEVYNHREYPELWDKDDAGAFTSIFRKNTPANATLDDMEKMIFNFKTGMDTYKQEKQTPENKGLSFMNPKALWNKFGDVGKYQQGIKDVKVQAKQRKEQQVKEAGLAGMEQAVSGTMGPGPATTEQELASRMTGDPRIMAAAPQIKPQTDIAFKTVSEPEEGMTEYEKARMGVAGRRLAEQQRHNIAVEGKKGKEAEMPGVPKNVAKHIKTRAEDAYNTKDESTAELWNQIGALKPQTIPEADSMFNAKASSVKTAGKEKVAAAEIVEQLNKLVSKRNISDPAEVAKLADQLVKTGPGIIKDRDHLYRVHYGMDKAPDITKPMTEIEGEPTEEQVESYYEGVTPAPKREAAPSLGIYGTQPAPTPGLPDTIKTGKQPVPKVGPRKPRKKRGGGF